MVMDGFVQRLAIRADENASLWLIFENTVPCQIFCPTGVRYLQVYLLIYCAHHANKSHEPNLHFLNQHLAGLALFKLQKCQDRFRKLGL